MKNKKLVLYVALAVSLGACGNDNESESSPVPDGRTALTVQGKIRILSISPLSVQWIFMHIILLSFR